MEIYGLSKNGVLSICRAKVENRGRGRCDHYEHYELERSEARSLNRLYDREFVERAPGADREEYLRGLRADTLKRVNGFPKVTEDSVRAHIDAKALDAEKFRACTIKLASSFDYFDHSLVTSFYEKLNERLGDEELVKSFESDVDNVYSFLVSGDEDAIRIRDFLGSEIDLRSFSELLISNSKSMTSSYSRGGLRTVPRAQRVLFTSIKNDMTRENYVSSVLYFGGRCCYCNGIIVKSDDSGNIRNNDATGEHLTPVTPDNKNAIRGGTRFGNMALACFGCNDERQSQDLEEWLYKTKRVDEGNKPLALRRINEFRKFASYEEFTQEQSDVIAAKGYELRQWAKKVKFKCGALYTPEDYQMVNDRINETIIELEKSLF